MMLQALRAWGERSCRAWLRAIWMRSRHSSPHLILGEPVIFCIRIGYRRQHLGRRAIFINSPSPPFGR